MRKVKCQWCDKILDMDKIAHTGNDEWSQHRSDTAHSGGIRIDEEGNEIWKQRK